MPLCGTNFQKLCIRRSALNIYRHEFEPLTDKMYDTRIYVSEVSRAIRIIRGLQYCVIGVGGIYFLLLYIQRGMACKSQNGVTVSQSAFLLR